MSYKIDRKTYAQTYGPTTGDRVRLADTELFIEVEKDLTTYGDEVKFGGGKVIRDGTGQSQVRRADGAVDTVITNALIVDWWGIIKADVGLKDGKILADYIKGSEVKIIEDCGHMMLLEEADQTLEILKKFIAEHYPLPS